MKQKSTDATLHDLSFRKDKHFDKITDQHSDLIEALPAAVYTCNAKGRITFYNEAAAKLWGRKPTIGYDLWCGSWKIYRPDGTQLPVDECPMAITLREGRVVKGEEIVIERPDGARINVLPHPRPIFDNKGKLIGAINMLVDVTDKRANEHMLLENENKYRQLAQSLEKAVEERTLSLKRSEELYHKMIEEVEDYAIILLDRDGFIMNWNKGAEKIKGYTEKEIIGQNFRIFYQDRDRKEKLPELLIQQAIKNGKAMHEGWRLRKDNNRFWGSIVITALHDQESNVIGFSKVTRDLTERKLAEDKLKDYANELEFQNRQLEEYAYVASHDLQEPLRKIKTFANLLERAIDDKAALIKYVGKINSAAGRMESLIRDVLQYSQLSNYHDLFSNTDLNNVLENVLLDIDLLVEQKQAKISFNDLPVIKGIPIQLHQLFSNLIANSVKFTNQNPIIEIYCEKILPGEIKMHSQLNDLHTYHKVIVKDNGIGFDQEYAEQIFKLFQRLNEEKYGTGIGLALCKKIVENHQGHITVTSTRGQGTIFNIYFPVLG